MAKLCAGVDEVGRGALIGHVVAAAVILPDSYDLPGLTDSKQLSAQQRERLFTAVCAQAIAWCWAQASPAEIDRLNIHHATLLAMQRAVMALQPKPTRIEVDGKFVPDVAMPARAIVKGDRDIPSIAAASIVAKVIRDRQMLELDAVYPMYGLRQNKGYPTKAHLAALYEHGVCPQHRISYAPVRRVLQGK